MAENDWETKKVFEKDATEMYYCDDPETDKLLRDIIFLYRKIKYLEAKIGEEYYDFRKGILEKLELENKQKVKSIKKDSTQEVTLKVTFLSSRADKELFFYLDTFFIDLRRIIEFSFRLIARFEGFGELSDFRLETLISHLSQDTKNLASNFSKLLMAKYPSYVEFIMLNKKWIETLNDIRTKSIHYKILNETGGFEIEYFWNSIKSLDKEPEIRFPDIPMFNRPIPGLIKENIANLKEFLNQTLTLRQDLIKRREIID